MVEFIILNTNSQMINLEEKIKEAMKAGDKTRLAVLRGIKTAEMEFKTAKNAKPLDEAAEIQILRKLVSQRNDAAKEYVAGGRNDLAENELREAEIIKEFLPAEVSREAIEKAARKLITDKEMRLMGTYIKELKVLFPGADGKVLSEVVKEIINETA